MFTDLLNRLPQAEGRSEFVIVVFCDVRGFSAFSTMQESANIAEFIKKFYAKLMKEYFPKAAFAKPTGDGLLLIFKYDETNLLELSADILQNCFRAMTDFPSFFAEDKMINFCTPDKLGFGIARGTACCLYSKGKTIDYSGRLLNLAARLHDLARPHGIVIDSAFQITTIPEALRKYFSENKVYIKGISEAETYPVLCSSQVELPDYAFTPYSTSEWKSIIKEMTVKDLLAMIGTYSLDIPSPMLSTDKAKLKLCFVNPKLKGYSTFFEIEKFKQEVDARGAHLKINLEMPKEKVKEYKLKQSEKVTFDFQYIPKPACSSVLGS